MFTIGERTFKQERVGSACVNPTHLKSKRLGKSQIVQETLNSVNHASKKYRRWRRPQHMTKSEQSNKKSKNKK